MTEVFVEPAFCSLVWDYYYQHRRSMPWRDDPSPYNVLVSEIMLQQTQVGRVEPKFQEFMERFPSLAKLAAASLEDVLRAWSGLGYNRRAKFLWQAAQAIERDFDGRIPNSLPELLTLPGVGRNTAGAMLAYAYNQPTVFIETNIRSVYFYHFFNDEEAQVTDAQLLPLLEATLDREHPREWYWALMDYGAYIKKQTGGQLQKSRHYTKQSTFQGSRRQLRGQILRELLTESRTRTQLFESSNDQRLDDVLRDLQNEGLVSINEGRYYIATTVG